MSACPGTRWRRSGGMCGLWKPGPTPYNKNDNERSRRGESQMKIHEYQAKELLAAAGAPVPRGIVCSTAEEVGKAFDAIGGPVVLKSQVHAGGRGKGGFKGSGHRPGGADEPKTIESIAHVFKD